MCAYDDESPIPSVKDDGTYTRAVEGEAIPRYLNQVWAAGSGMTGVRLPDEVPGVDGVNKTCYEMALVVETLCVVSDDDALMKTIVTSWRNRTGMSPLSPPMRYQRL